MTTRKAKLETQAASRQKTGTFIDAPPFFRQASAQQKKPLIFLTTGVVSLLTGAKRTEKTKKRAAVFLQTVARFYF